MEIALLKSDVQKLGELRLDLATHATTQVQRKNRLLWALVKCEDWQFWEKLDPWQQKFMRRMAQAKALGDIPRITDKMEAKLEEILMGKRGGPWETDEEGDAE